MNILLFNRQPHTALSPLPPRAHAQRRVPQATTRPTAGSAFDTDRDQTNEEGLPSRDFVMPSLPPCRLIVQPHRPARSASRRFERLPSSSKCHTNRDPALRYPTTVCPTPLRSAAAAGCHGMLRQRTSCRPEKLNCSSEAWNGTTELNSCRPVPRMNSSTH